MTFTLASLGITVAKMSLACQVGRIINHHFNTLPSMTSMNINWLVMAQYTYIMVNQYIINEV